MICYHYDKRHCKIPNYLNYQSCYFNSVQFSSVTQSCPILCDPVDCSTSGFPVHHQPREFAQLTSIMSVMPSNHLILCRPILLLPSVFPTVRVFSNKSVLHIRWRKYWNFSFSISPSSEYSSYWCIQINYFLIILPNLDQH